MIYIIRGVRLGVGESVSAGKASACECDLFLAGLKLRTVLVLRVYEVWHLPSHRLSEMASREGGSPLSRFGVSQSLFF